MPGKMSHFLAAQRKEDIILLWPLGSIMRLVLSTLIRNRLAAVLVYCWFIFFLVVMVIQPSEGLAAPGAAAAATTTTTGSTTPSSFSDSKSHYRMINMNELLSTCVDACNRGCAEIRKVQQEREHQLSSSSSCGNSGPQKNDIAFSILKDANDPKSALTQADGAAQTAIVDSLRNEWGSGLRIVGEEEEAEDVRKTNDRAQEDSPTSPTKRPLRRDLCLDLLKGREGGTDADDNSMMMVKLSDITIFVDPLDGTREFVESRLSNCQSLVGITVDDEPVAGVQGIPFPDGTLGSSSTTPPTFVYAHVGVGHGITSGSTLSTSTEHAPAAPAAVATLLPSNDYSNEHTQPLIGSGDSTHPVMEKCRELSGCTNVLYGGAGNKILAVAAGHLDCSIALKYGGPWDVCAPQAVLVAMGGRITTLSGDDIRETYMGDGTPNVHCKMGFIATGANSVTDHDQLVAALRDTQEMQDYLKTILS